MNEKREKTRFENAEILSDLCSIFLVLSDGVEIISKLVDLSSIGMRLTLPTDKFYDEKISWKGQAVIINFPLMNIKVPAECVYIERHENSTMSMGVFFTNPYHHNMFHELLKLSADSRMLV